MKPRFFTINHPDGPFHYVSYDGGNNWHTLGKLELPDPTDLGGNYQPGNVGINIVSLAADDLAPAS